MEKCFIYLICISIFFSACVSQSKYESAVTAKEKAEYHLSTVLHSRDSMVSSYEDTIDLFQRKINNSKTLLKDSISEINREYAAQMNETIEKYSLDRDADGIPDYKDQEPNTSLGSIVNRNGETIHPVTRIVIKEDESGNLTDIPMGHVLQNYIAIPHCPDSIEVNTPGYIEVLIDFTSDEDSVDIDILEVAINHTDTANTKLIRKRIYKKDICSIAKYLKVVVNSDAGSALLITPEPSSDEYVKVSDLFNSKRVYKWKVRCSTVGSYGYTIHVVWYNTNEGQPTTLRQDEITTCPNKIIVYEIGKTLWAKFVDILSDNLWKGISAAIAFILGVFGKGIWNKIFGKKAEPAT